MTQKIVINQCCGGYGLSQEAIQAVADRKGMPIYVVDEFMGNPIYARVPAEEYDRLHMEYIDSKGTAVDMSSVLWDPSDIARDDPDLVAVVEQLGSEKASGMFASLKVVEIPDDVEWVLQENDNGCEWIAEKHRTWD